MDARMWRVVEETDEHGKPWTWHSLSCVCSGCLDADAAADVFDNPELVDTTQIEDQCVKESSTTSDVTKGLVSA